MNINVPLLKTNYNCVERVRVRLGVKAKVGVMGGVMVGLGLGAGLGFRVLGCKVLGPLQTW